MEIKEIVSDAEIASRIQTPDDLVANLNEHDPNLFHVVRILMGINVLNQEQTQILEEFQASIYKKEIPKRATDTFKIKLFEALIEIIKIEILSRVKRPSFPTAEEHKKFNMLEADIADLLKSCESNLQALAGKIMELKGRFKQDIEEIRRKCRESIILEQAPGTAEISFGRPE